jgi:uncharacterized protein involved in exopolysaccharide biosynthesis
LEASKTDARSLAAAPNRLLEAQPVLRRLKDGLVDAQLHTAQLSGNLTENHPSVIAAKISEQEIVDHMRSEIDASLVGIQAELRLSQARANVLQSQLTYARGRLSKLADIRAEYANLVAERNQRADILKTNEQQLAEAQASHAAARTASLITAIDAPVPSTAPVGPGKSTIVLGGLLAGLVIGLGILFLTVNPAQLDRSVESTTEATLDEFQNHSFPTKVPADVAFQTAAAASVFTSGGFCNEHAANGHHVNGYATNGHAVCTHGLSLKQALRKLATARQV